MTERTYGSFKCTLEEIETPSIGYEPKNYVLAMVAHIRELQAVAATMYQVLGVYDAPEKVLDLVLAAANGEKLPYEPLNLLPFHLNEDKLAAERARSAKLVEALEITRKTIGRQLDLIDERAADAVFLDKQPIVQSLKQHAKRLNAAYEAYQSSKEQNDG